ncbi:hypothetical protein ACLB1N_21230 [Escherichia coli]
MSDVARYGISRQPVQNQTVAHSMLYSTGPDNFSDSFWSYCLIRNNPCLRMFIEPFHKRFKRNIFIDKILVEPDVSVYFFRDYAAPLLPVPPDTPG